MRRLGVAPSPAVLGGRSFCLALFGWKPVTPIRHSHTVINLILVRTRV